MSHKEIAFDSLALDQWATDGGSVPPDEEQAEQRRLSVALLRDWFVPIVGNENDFSLLASIVGGSVTASDFADAMGLHRCNGKRRVEASLRRLRTKLASQPQLCESMPSPWREAFRTRRPG